MIAAMTVTFNRSQKIRRSFAALLLATTLITATPGSSFAAKYDEEDPTSHYDARMQGYDHDPDVELDHTSGGGNWAMLILSAVVCVAVIFKDAKRSHLD